MKYERARSSLPKPQFSTSRDAHGPIFRLKWQACVAITVQILAFATFAQTSLDSFDPGVIGSVNAIALQPDGMIQIGGTFDRIGGQSRSNLARLNSDGTLDATFNADTDGGVYALAVGPDG